MRMDTDMDMYAAFGYVYACVCVSMSMFMFCLCLYVCMRGTYFSLCVCVYIYIYVYTHISSCRGPHKAAPLNARMVAAYGLTFLPPGGRGLWFEASTLPNDKALGITWS